MKTVKLTFLFIAILLQCQGQNLLQEGKLWSNTVIGTMVGSTYQSYFIKFMGDTVINGLAYKKILKSEDEFHENWSLYDYIREEANTGKVFIFNRDVKRDWLLYDFSLEEGDSILTGGGYEYAKVVKVDYATFGNSPVIRKQIYFFETSGLTRWIEGIGSTWGILEGLSSFFTAGAERKLVCYYENDQLIYHNDWFIHCFPAGPDVSILNENLQWNIGTHCVNEGPINPYDRWSTSFMHIEGDTIKNQLHYKKLISCADPGCGSKILKSYIREVAGKVYLANKTNEVLQYNFNLQKGNTMIMNVLPTKSTRYYIKVDSVKRLYLKDYEERIAQYVTVSDYHEGVVTPLSINDVFVEGIGSLKFGVEYPNNLFTTGNIGCSPNLLCFYSGQNSIYFDPKINNCNLSTGVTQLQQANLIKLYNYRPGILEIQLSAVKAGRLFVFDINGKQILAETIHHSGASLCLPSSGIYLYKFEAEKGKVQTGKVLVK
ncbi:MAG: hypothetical protein ACM3P1_04205 [Candidatus Saccharibacteria bacterium]